MLSEEKKTVKVLLTFLSFNKQFIDLKALQLTKNFFFKKK